MLVETAGDCILVNILRAHTHTRGWGGGLPPVFASVFMCAMCTCVYTVCSFIPTHLSFPFTHGATTGDMREGEGGEMGEDSKMKQEWREGKWWLKGILVVKQDRMREVEGRRLVMKNEWLNLIANLHRKRFFPVLTLRKSFIYGFIQLTPSGTETKLRPWSEIPLLLTTYTWLLVNLCVQNHLCTPSKCCNPHCFMVALIDVCSFGWKYWFT